MKARTLIILLLAAAILGGLAHLSTTRRNRKGSPADAGKNIFPVLQQDEVLEDINKIVVRSADKTLTFARAENTWVAADKYNYPADFEKIRDFVRNIAELKVGQAVPGGEDEIEELQLVSPDSSETNKTEHVGTLVRLEDKSGNAVISMVVGKERMTKPSGPTPPGRPGGYPDGRYLAAEGRIVLVSEGFHDLPGKPQHWLDTSIVNVPASDIAEIVITSPDRRSVTLKRPDEGGNFRVQKLSPKEDPDASKINSVAGILNYLHFDDVADPSLSDTHTGLDNPTVYTARTSKGQLYTLKIGSSPENSETRYVRLEAAYEPPPIKETSEDEDESDEDNAQDEKKEQKKLADETLDLNKKVRQWTYLVRPYGLDSISTDTKDYIKKKEETGKATTPEPEGEKKEKKGLMKKLMPWKK
jgi:hypothetical protein